MDNTYLQQIERAKAVVSGWSEQKKSWMHAQGTNEYLEKRVLDKEIVKPERTTETER